MRAKENFEISAEPIATHISGVAAKRGEDPNT